MDKMSVFRVLNYKNQSFYQEQGQILLLVVLVMVVTLTVGLSIASKSIVNLRTTEEEENSSRALYAAEAGIEKALKTGTGITVPETLENNAVIKEIKVTDINGVEFLLNGEKNPVDKDDGVDVWLVPHKADESPDYSVPWSGNLTFYWGSSIDGCDHQAALEVIIISGQLSSPISERRVFDPCSSRIAENSFSPALVSGTTISGTVLQFKTTVIPVVSGFVARVIPLYENTIVGVTTDAGTPLPTQGKSIEAVGTSLSTTRKVGVFKPYPKLPSELFQYVLFWPVGSTPTP